MAHDPSPPQESPPFHGQSSLALADVHASRKRPRAGPDGRPAYPRKRAAQACLTCRRKRIKCDNERPSCTSCSALAIECVYQEGDKSSFDTASLAILQRLDHLEDLFKTAHPETRTLAPLSSSPVVLPVPALNNFTPATLDRENPLKFCSISVETILEWPTLRVPTSSQRPELKSLLRACTPNSESRLLQPSDLDTNGALLLLQLFLDHIHIYNPILKVPDVEEYVKYAVLNGLGWDAKSCLLLLIYALGTIATQDGLSTTSSTSLELRQTAQFQRADAFFQAAQKRMGLLLCNSGIIEAQVFFLAGVYLMMTMKPIEAWKMFVQALACCQAFSPTTGESQEEECQLHRTMYWTCFKSEIELRLEMSVIETSAWNLRYPTFFPEPPKNLQSHSEPAWYFYLAEIALRRLENRILTHICQTSSSDVSLTDQVLAVVEFEQQADSWSESLPESLNLESPRPEESYGDDENHAAFRFILNGHLLDCYEMMYWLFVVNAIHGRLRDDPNSKAQQFARRGLEICVRRIKENETGFRHRHHGTWLMLRSCTRSALMLIAAARSGLSAILPREWEASIAKVMELLRYWQGEILDASDRLKVLEALMKLNA